jgi:hypothetical protein
VDRTKWPTWVRIALWGLPNRGSAWFFFWLAMAIAAGCVAAGFVNRLLLCGGIMVLAAFGYYQSIRWVDRHDRWS